MISAFKCPLCDEEIPHCAEQSFLIAEHRDMHIARDARSIMKSEIGERRLLQVEERICDNSNEQVKLWRVKTDEYMKKISEEVACGHDKPEG